METIKYWDFIARMVIVLALYGALLVEVNNDLHKPKLWKLSVLAGMLGNGVSGIGYLLPHIIPFPDRIGLITNAVFLTGVFFSYVLALNTSEVRTQRNAILREMGFATLATIVLGIVVANIRTAAQVEDTGRNVVEGISDLEEKFDQFAANYEKAATRRDNRLAALEKSNQQSAYERTAILINQGYMQADLSYLKIGIGELLARKGKAKSVKVSVPAQPIPLPKELPVDKPGFFRRIVDALDPNRVKAMPPTGKPGGGSKK